VEYNDVNNDNIDIVHGANIMFHPSMEQFEKIFNWNKWMYLGVLLYNMDDNK